MKELFKIKDLFFYEEEFLDDIKDYEDIIPIIKELERKLDYEKLAVTEDNECCGKSRDNYFTQIHGYINNEDEFIRIYKCCDCGKWIIDILE